jgi:hypothetical protein
LLLHAAVTKLMDALDITARTNKTAITLLVSAMGPGKALLVRRSDYTVTSLCLYFFSVSVCRRLYI